MSLKECTYRHSLLKCPNIIINIELRWNLANSLPIPVSDIQISLQWSSLVFSACWSTIFIIMDNLLRRILLYVRLNALYLDFSVADKYKEIMENTKHLFLFAYIFITYYYLLLHV